MGKNIIICCDGTGNEYGENNTNVVGAYEAFVRDQEQIAFYDPGVGTFDVLGRTIGKKVGYLLGLLFGWGLEKNLEKNIEDAYAYLMEHYDPVHTTTIRSICSDSAAGPRIHGSVLGGHAL